MGLPMRAPTLTGSRKAVDWSKVLDRGVNWHTHVAACRGESQWMNESGEVGKTSADTWKAAWINDLQGVGLKNGVNRLSPGRCLVERLSARLTEEVVRNIAVHACLTGRGSHFGGVDRCRSAAIDGGGAARFLARSLDNATVTRLDRAGVAVVCFSEIGDLLFREFRRRFQHQPQYALGARGRGQ